MELSERLKMVASLVTPGYKLADIGTDHAYIPIFLVQEEIIPSAVAMDVKTGPLKRAEEHIKEAGLESRIQTRLSDGLANLHPKEVDSIVIAGMGGGLILHILQEHWETTLNLKECILQPQSEVALVRAFLLKKGFSFLLEEMVLEDGKYYPIMKVVPPDSCDSSFMGKNPIPLWNETELRYGKYLLENSHPVLYQFLKKEKQIYEQILQKLNNNTGERIEHRKSEIEKILIHIKEGLSYYEM